MWPPWSRGESKLLYEQSSWHAHYIHATVIFSWHAHYIVIGHTMQ